MAIRLPISHGVVNSSRRQVVFSEIRSGGRFTVMSSSRGVKQRGNSSGISEDAASRLSREMSILELERMYRTGDPVLQGSGPGDFPGSGFSGKPVRVAYQGVRGSYCQEAAAKAFSTCNAFPCAQMEDAFQALEDKTADRAIIPVENSIDGVIERNLDLLLRHEASIVGELVLPVNHCLLGVPGSTASDLRRIVSHPQAVSHCKTRVEALDVVIEEVPNSADAARFLSENPVADTAVIGSKIAAKEFGLQVIQENFQDGSGENRNRFLQLGLNPIVPRPDTTGVRKTTVAFSLTNGVSDLFRALWSFETRNIPVSWVQHRPNRNLPVRLVESEGRSIAYFDYIFIVDIQGSITDRAVEIALNQLKEITGFQRVLGSYLCR